MPRKYAQGTTVPVQKTIAEIERLIIRHGGDQFLQSWTADTIKIAFRINNRMLKFTVPLPKDVSIAERRRLWRCLLLAIKAKFEIVATGIEEFDSAFMSNIVMPDGSTFGDWAIPQIDHVYETGKFPEEMMLIGGPES